MDMTDLNMHYFPRMDSYKMTEYLLIGKAHGLTLENHVNTQCSTTVEATKFILSGETNWKPTTNPGNVFEVVMDEGEHCLIVNNNDVYHSLWKEFGLRNDKAIDPYPNATTPEILSKLYPCCKKNIIL